MRARPNTAADTAVQIKENSQERTSKVLSPEQDHHWRNRPFVGLFCASCVVCRVFSFSSLFAFLSCSLCLVTLCCALALPALSATTRLAGDVRKKVVWRDEKKKKKTKKKKKHNKRKSTCRISSFLG